VFTPEKHGKLAKIHGTGALDRFKRPVAWSFLGFSDKSKTRKRKRGSTDADAGITVTVRPVPEAE
jgi:hypothetical protein